MDSFTHALEELDPISRALVELSLRRGVDDEDIAGMLGLEEADVADQREDALRELATKVAPHAKDAGLSELEDAVSAAIWAPEAEEAAAEPEEAAAEPEEADDQEPDTHELGAYVPELEPATEEPATQEPDSEPDLAAQIDAARAAAAANDREATRPRLHVVPEPEPESPSVALEPIPPRRTPKTAHEQRQSRLKILIPFLVVALIAAILVGVQRSDDGTTSSEPASTPAPPPAQQAETPAEPPKEPAKPAGEAKPSKEPKDTKPAAPKGTRLTALPGAADGAKGTASIQDGRLTLRVTGLPSGAYGVWLYNSLIDSKQIGTGKNGKVSLDVKLPAGASDYEYVDVSLEPGDGNPNHSGESLLRVPLDKLER